MTRQKSGYNTTSVAEVTPDIENFICISSHASHALHSLFGNKNDTLLIHKICLILSFLSLKFSPQALLIIIRKLESFCAIVLKTLMTNVNKLNGV